MEYLEALTDRPYQKGIEAVTIQINTKCNTSLKNQRATQRQVSVQSLMSWERGAGLPPVFTTSLLPA
jgi:hypothetical protein